MDIVYISDDNYFDITLVSVNSLLKNSNIENAEVIIVYVGERINEKKIKVKNYNEKIFNKKIKLISVDKDLVKSIHTKNHVSQAAYVKFYIPLLFKDKDEILFIDGDTLVLEDISELKNVVKDIEEPIAAVWNPFYNYDNHLFNKNKAYKTFNSGVIYMNLKKLRELNSTKLLLDALAIINEDSKLNDQAVFNYVFVNNWYALPCSYNVQSTFYFHNSDKLEINNQRLIDIRNNPKIVHFTSNSKPWMYRNSHPFKENFRKEYLSVFGKFPENKKSIKGYVQKIKEKKLLRSQY
ncbi:glycosyltransferase family 8 protein [Vagococcus lutrae]|uniref:glycosyltransferase family 8 protein n=1 Tax=Vagococcus lutrae TaxID=81947 RepID=UPI00200EEE81|nr:glycosyltransferase family 8 protein [Vagococcus lutrae]UQF24038.1 glycosyltransferase family 8 protein [Vagococcus lutrae]UQF63871.1 glycosyltransferase family 8 protein [Vagococcus lutrae]